MDAAFAEKIARATSTIDWSRARCWLSADITPAETAACRFWSVIAPARYPAPRSRLCSSGSAAAPPCRRALLSGIASDASFGASDVRRGQVENALQLERCEL